jgi:hypothetical protein
LLIDLAESRFFAFWKMWLIIRFNHFFGIILEHAYKLKIVFFGGVDVDNDFEVFDDRDQNTSSDLQFCKSHWVGVFVVRFSLLQPVNSSFIMCISYLVR